MTVTVASPVRGQTGNTTIAALLSLSLARTQRKKVCLTHLSSGNDSLPTYLGLPQWDENGCSPTQLAKLLRTSSITAQDMEDYCRSLTPNLDIFSTGTGLADEEDLDVIRRYVLSHMPHDFLVVDVDMGFSEPVSAYAMNKADLLVIAVTQSRSVLNRYKEVFEGGPPKDAIFVCNHYTPEAGSIPSLAKSLRTSPRQVCPLAHSDSILKLGNEGRLEALPALAKSVPLPTLEANIKTMTQTVMTRFNLRKMKGDSR